MAFNTIPQSRADLQIGPILSMLQLNAIAPFRLTRPNVGRRPVAPHRVDGETIDPNVSVPMAKATSPATVAEAEPADDPLDPCFKSHGFFVTPPYQISPIAKAPSVNLPSKTAPAASSFLTTVAVSFNT